MGYPSGTKHINKYNVALRGFKMKGLNLETGTQNEDLISSQATNIKDRILVHVQDSEHGDTVRDGDPDGI